MSANDSETIERGYSAEEIAKVLGKRAQFVRDLIHSGALKAYRVGIDLRVFRKDLETYLEANVNTGPAPARRTRGRRSKRESPSTRGASPQAPRTRRTPK